MMDDIEKTRTHTVCSGKNIKIEPWCPSGGTYGSIDIYLDYYYSHITGKIKHFSQDIMNNQ